MTPWSRVGCRGVIVRMLHSPAGTRDYASCLIGRQGTVVSVLRNGTYALIELDGEPDESPGGVRRWSVHWDDLEISYGTAQSQQADAHRLGTSWSGHRVVHHAVPADSIDSLCGNPVQPLPMLEWSMPFDPKTRRACPECVHELEQRIGRE